MGYDLNKILVLGASGYIGFGIYTKLIDQNYNCIGTSKTQNLPFFKLNLLNKKKIQKLFKIIKPTLIVHCANNIPNQKINFYENYKITSNILKYSQRIPIIFFSSMTIYNESKKKIFSEKNHIKINRIKNSYAYYKKKTEELILKRKLKGDVCVRIPGVFGALRHTGIVSHIISSLLRNKNISIKFKKENWSAIYYDHLLELILKIIKSNNIYQSTIVNVAYKRKVSIPILLKKICKKMNKKMPQILKNDFKVTKFCVKNFESKFGKIYFTFDKGLDLMIKNVDR